MGKEVEKIKLLKLEIKRLELEIEKIKLEYIPPVFIPFPCQPYIPIQPVPQSPIETPYKITCAYYS